MTVLMGARTAFSQDAGDSAAGADASLEGTAPALHGDVETEENVLEIPQLTRATGSDGDADGQAINASSPGAPAYVLMSSPLTQAARPALNPGPSMISPSSPYVPMSGPLTQAARPPLNPGPWMLSPSMSPFSHPAGSPMIGMTMLHPSLGPHH